MVLEKSLNLILTNGPEHWPLVLWHCWLGDWKGIRPVRTSTSKPIHSSPCICIFWFCFPFVVSMSAVSSKLLNTIPLQWWFWKPLQINKYVPVCLDYNFCLSWWILIPVAITTGMNALQFSYLSCVFQHLTGRVHAGLPDSAPISLFGC